MGKKLHKPNNSENRGQNDTNDTPPKKSGLPPGNTPSTGNEGIKKSVVNSNGKTTNINLDFHSTETGVKSTMIPDINDTNDTFDTPRVSLVSSIIDLSKVFGFGVFEQILCMFYKSADKSYNYDEIAENIKQKKDYTKVVFNRNREYFQEAAKEDGMKSFQLSPFGINYCKKQVENYNKRLEQAQKQLQQRDQKKLTGEELVEKTKKIISETKQRRHGKIIYLDIQSISEWDPEYADRLLDTPLEIINIIKEEMSEIGFDDVRIENLPNSEILPVERVRSKHIGRLICIEGRCVSLSSVRPVIKTVKFECPSCGTIVSVKQENKTIQDPLRCSCGRRGGFKELSKDVIDIARIILEDLQEKTDNPNTQRLEAYIEGSLTTPQNIGVFTPGEEIKVTGIVREIKKITQSGISVLMGLAFQILNAEKIEEEVVIDNLTEEEKQKIEELSKSISLNGMDEINSSFAPEVYGYKQQKNAIILQCCNRRNEPKKSSTRNKLSILMIGDPGIAKTVLGKFATSVTQHSKMAAGGGSSAVGITASVIKEDESMGGYRVEPGAMVLAKELLFLDEMNNITDDDKPKLQQGMSEQQISINKANIHVNLKVQGGMLATANPIKGHFEDGDVSSQFNIPSPILNRFDVIFVMRDIIDATRDAAITDIMIKRRKKEIKPKYDKDFLKKFFTYVRMFPEPNISEHIGNKIKKIYIDSRKTSGSSVIINPRFIESLTRLIEASAKLRLAKEVEEKDIERAMEILSKSHFQVNEYGNFNFD